MVSEGVLELGSAPRRRVGRRLAIVLGVLVLLATVLLGGAGWYYAGEIDAEALAVDPGGDPPRYDLVVRSFSGSEVVLRRTGEAPERDPLTSGDVYGLVWPGGSGVLAARVGNAGARRLVVVAGDPPAEGMPAALEVDVWADPQQAHQVAYDEVTFPCAGGECPAWYVPGGRSTWFVAVHGKGAERSEPLRALGPAISLGLPALVIGYRNDADAPADPSGRYGYGATEWQDLEAAVEFAVGHGAESVVLFGSSMGGGIVAAFLERSESARLVRGVVLDSPMLDLRATVEHGASRRQLPVLGTPIPGVLTATAEWLAGRRYDLDWDAVDYLPGDWLTVPALVFHGTEDDVVPIATTERLRRAHPTLVEEVRVDGATHVASWNADPGIYEEREVAFLGCVSQAAVASCPGAGLLEVAA